MKYALLAPAAKFSLLLQNCLKAKALKPCQQLHALILISCIDINVLSLHSKLIGTYAACGDLTSAKLIFQNTQNPNVFAFNWFISASAFHGLHEEAIGYFKLFQESLHYCPNKYTFSILLKVIVGLMDIKKGKELHTMIYKMGFEIDVSVSNALIDMYTKCGDIGYGCAVFDQMPERDVASWTSMISGYSNVGNIDRSVALFERMRLEGFRPNDFTWNAMISGYARKGDTDSASVLFSRMSEEGLIPDLVTWNAMISGFVQGGKISEAFGLFHNMLLDGIRPNQVTVAALLPACGVIGSIHRGKEIHGFIYRTDLSVNDFVASALIDMYSKCGSVNKAWCVFNAIPFKNVAAWNAMMGCYGKHGLVDRVVELFEMMTFEGVKGNEVTLITVLSGCGHGGLVDKGLEIFRSIKKTYDFDPSKEHYACLIDLLCRSGRMDEAYNMIMEMPMKATDSIIGAFLNGCKIQERRDLVEKLAEDVVKLELKKPAGFVTLSNLYASMGQWEEVENVRKVMKDKGAFKPPGSSWV